MYQQHEPNMLTDREYHSGKNQSTLLKKILSSRGLKFTISLASLCVFQWVFLTSSISFKYPILIITFSYMSIFCVFAFSPISKIELKEPLTVPIIEIGGLKTFSDISSAIFRLGLSFFVSTLLYERLQVIGLPSREEFAVPASYLILLAIISGFTLTYYFSVIMLTFFGILRLTMILRCGFINTGTSIFAGLAAFTISTLSVVALTIVIQDLIPFFSDSILTDIQSVLGR